MEYTYRDFKAHGCPTRMACCHPAAACCEPEDCRECKGCQKDECHCSKKQEQDCSIRFSGTLTVEDECGCTHCYQVSGTGR